MKHKKHRHSSRDRDLDPLRKVPKREPRSSSPSRGHEDRERERERDRDREKRKEKVRIKEEPTDSEDHRERERPSSSRWDEDDEQGHHRSRGHGRDGGSYEAGDQDGGVRRFRHDDRGGRGRGRGRGRGGGSFHPNKKHFPKEEDTSHMEWGKKTDNSEKKSLPPGERDKPNFGLSGKLTEETNTYKGVVIKYSEPPEARVPKRRWRLYPFKGDEELKVLHLHRASAFLMGRERKVVDIPLDHPSCSKQHAALQFRLVHYTRDDGSAGKRIRPYIIDLDSANGTFVNNNKIEPRKYVELLERDVLKFGFSSREYVLLHEHSKDDDDDADDV